MSGYATIIGLLLCLLQVAFAISADEYAAKAPNNVWPTAAADEAKRVPFESVNDVAAAVLKNAGYPKVVRRGYAGEEFFMKASKSVPRIGRRNDAGKESTKRSSDQMTVFWPKHDFDIQNGCHQLDAKTVYLADPYNYACNDQFYCCETPAKPRNGPTVNYV